MQKITIGYIGNFVTSFFIFLLLIAVYSYVDKIEKTGCVCSEHPNRDFIKKFSVFVFLFLIFNMVVSTNLIVETLGETIAGIFIFVKLIFYIICIVYFYTIIDYTRFLINEKCKCSEDIRREFILAGSVVEISLLLLILMTVVILPNVFNSARFMFKNMYKNDKEMDVVNTPKKIMKNLPSLKQTKSAMKQLKQKVFRKK